ncbi:MAG: DUF2059 domain-containing protein [Acidobacteriaceae bacterium]
MKSPVNVRSVFLASILLGSFGCVLGSAQQKNNSPSPSAAKSPATAKNPAATVPALTPVANPATAAQIHELLQLTGASRNADLMVGRMVQAAKQQAPAFFPQDFWTDLQQSFQHLDAEGLMVPYFQKYYSQADVQKAIAFYKTPAGKRLVDIQPIIMQQTQKIVMQRAQDVGHQVLLRHKQELEALAKQYQQQRGTQGAPPPSGSPAGAPTAPQK